MERKRKERCLDLQLSLSTNPNRHGNLSLDSKIIPQRREGGIESDLSLSLFSKEKPTTKATGMLPLSDIPNKSGGGRNTSNDLSLSTLDLTMSIGTLE